MGANQSRRRAAFVRPSSIKGKNNLPLKIIYNCYSVVYQNIFRTSTNSTSRLPWGPQADKRAQVAGNLVGTIDKVACAF